MVLVVAAALGALGHRAGAALLSEKGTDRGHFGLECWEMLVGPWLAAVTAGSVVLRLLPPRSPRVELFRQPGFAAAVVALALTGRRFLDAMLRDRLIGWDDWYLEMEWIEGLREASLGIIVTLSTLALAGCLRPERSWIDRTARAVASIWVLAGIASWALPIAQSMWLNHLGL